jgi:hypothetical protein
MVIEYRDSLRIKFGIKPCDFRSNFSDALKSK